MIEGLGLTGRAAEEVLGVIDKAEQSRRAASVIGFVGLVWAGLGIVGTLEQAMDATWQVKGRGVISKAIGLAWLVGAGALFLASLSLGPVITALPGPGVVPTVILGLALDLVLFLWMFRTLTHVPLPWSAHLPGAVVGAVGLELLKLIGTVYVPRAVASASALYGSLGVVFAILAWLALAARLILYAAAYNVVRWEAEHGTVTIGIEVPRIEGEVPLEATRGGAGERDGPRTSSPPNCHTPCVPFPECPSRSCRLPTAAPRWSGCAPPSPPPRTVIRWPRSGSWCPATMSA